MFYFKVTKDCSFFGQDFFEGELLTEKEALRWQEKQNNRLAGAFMLKNWQGVSINPKRTFWLFGARYEKPAE